MPDYSKPPVFLTETKMFKDWLKEKGYQWPYSQDERDALVCQFQREGFGSAQQQKDQP